MLGVAYTDDKEAAVSIKNDCWAGSLAPALYSQRIYTPEMSEKNGSVVGKDTIEQKDAHIGRSRGACRARKQVHRSGIYESHFAAMPNAKR